MRRSRLVAGRRHIGGIGFGDLVIDGSGLVQTRWRSWGSHYGGIGSLAEGPVG